MKAELVERSEVYVRCPQCGDENSHRISQLPKGANFGISYCEKCGTGIEGHVISLGQVEIRVADESKEPSYILLRFNPEERPIFLMVEANSESESSYGIRPTINARQIIALRYDGLPEKRRSIKYVVPTVSNVQTDTGEKIG